MLTMETTTTLPPLVVALVVDVEAGQTGKASEGSSHEKVAYFITACSVTFKSASYFPLFEVMGEKGAMWWTVLPSLPCPDKDLVQSVLNLQKQYDVACAKVIKYIFSFSPHYLTISTL